MFVSFPQDINECREIPDVCGAGECVNTLGSFHCRCEEGYSVKPDGGPQCTDEDECDLGTFVCDENADCINNPVSVLKKKSNSTNDLMYFATKHFLQKNLFSFLGFLSMSMSRRFYRQWY